jgi:hypothetical protein
MKQRAPAFQFFPRQFAGDDQIMGMDLEAIGAHILLMCAAAASPEQCRIDAEEYAIRMRLRNPADEAWQRIKKQLLAGAWKVTADGKWWVQDGLRRTFEKQKDFSERQSEKANARWSRKDAEAMPDPFRRDADAMPEAVPKVCSSSSSSSSKNKPGAPSRTNAERMPETGHFNPTEFAQILCSENGWSGEKMIWALKDAIEFQSKQMPETTLEQVGEWLVRAYFERKSAKGDFAGAPQKFFEQALYRDSGSRPSGSRAKTFSDNPATRALAQMEGD